MFPFVYDSSSRTRWFRLVFSGICFILNTDIIPFCSYFRQLYTTVEDIFFNITPSRILLISIFVRFMTRFPVHTCAIMRARFFWRLLNRLNNLFCTLCTVPSFFSSFCVSILEKYEKYLMPTDLIRTEKLMDIKKTFKPQCKFKQKENTHLN